MTELTIDQALQKGVEFHKAGKVNEADRLYTAIIKAQPNHPHANHNMGVLAVGVGKVQEALPYFKAALAADPSIAQFWFSLIETLIKLEKFSDAKMVLDRARSKNETVDGFDKLEQRLLEAQNGPPRSLVVASDEYKVKPNILDRLTLDQAITLAKKRTKEGSLEKAKSIYKDILTKFPKNKRAVNGLKALVSRLDNKVSEFQEPSQDQMRSLVELFNRGQLKQVLKQVEIIVAQFPDSIFLHNICGATYQKLGQLELSIEAYKKALAIKPDYLEARYNIGNVLQEQGKLTEALKSYIKALAINPDHPDANNNIGNIFKKQGKLEHAIAAYSKALAMNPTHCGALMNMANTLKEQDKLDEAIDTYRKALAINPNDANIYNNMGNAFKELGRLEQALEAFDKAIVIDPNHSSAYNNMGNALTDQGQLEDAILAYKKAIAINPDDSKAWNNVATALQAIKFTVPSQTELISYYPKDTGSKIYSTLLDYNLNLGGAGAKTSLAEALDVLSETEGKVIKNPKTSTSGLETPIQSLDRLFALVHFGRSGTGLLHSLIDGHPEISTLPSIYLSEYFDSSTWDKIIYGGWSEMVDNFIRLYDVLFDANSEVPIQTKGKKLLYNLGHAEGMTNVGNNKDKSLRLDKATFRIELQRLVNSYDSLDALLFFKLVHISYDKAISDKNDKNLIFYHIHNPDVCAQINFYQLAENSNVIMMVREPIQSCESWVRDLFHQNDYGAIVQRIRTMLFEVDSIVYQGRNCVGVRLEDLKERPRQTIPALCNWMGIEETESLYEMTAQGKKWWGDPTSPDYNNDGMKPFGTTSITRKVGSIFGDSDQFILKTLFYPFMERFGYAEKNADQFQSDLEKIRPLLDNLFEFENTIIKKSGVSPESFVKSGSYLYLRSGLIERWNTLKRYGTYPTLITPLKI